jgi:hypothetical protein
MKLTILNDHKPIGKNKSHTQHPIQGKIRNVEFQNEEEFKLILEELLPNECLTVGIYPDGYHYVPASKIDLLTQPKYITRSSSEASPGHILLIDCDLPQFATLRGRGLHDFLSKYMPDIFGGAAYVTTRSTSYYTKGKDAFHQYYFFKHPTDFKPLMHLLTKLFIQHNILTYTLASNYSRTFIKTPLDIKMHELQMPIFESSPNV